MHQMPGACSQTCKPSGRFGVATIQNPDDDEGHLPQKLWLPVMRLRTRPRCTCYLCYCLSVKRFEANTYLLVRLQEIQASRISSLNDMGCPIRYPVLDFQFGRACSLCAAPASLHLFRAGLPVTDVLVPKFPSRRLLRIP